MKKKRLPADYLIVLFLWIISFYGCVPHTEQSIPDNELTPGEWHFKGHLGDYIDTIAKHRILDKKSWEAIYPETEEAFVLKVDDRNYPESGQWRGEFWGKYMLSAIAAAKYYHSKELKQRIAKAVDGLLSHMDKDGYLGTYKHPDFVEGNNWNVWCRKYTLWGLLESWELLREPKILDAAKKFTDQLMTIVGPGKKDIIKTGNFYGLPSTSILYPVVKLYRATGEKKYLDYAEYIVKQWSEHPEGIPDILNKGLSGEPVHTWFPDKDSYKWAKGYEFMSCVEGLVELYKVTGRERYFKAAENIYHAIEQYERTCVGSVSFNDKFVGSAGLINTLSEICDVVYWNRFSYALFSLTGESKYVDEMEWSLYNSLLCAFNKEGTWGLRRLRTSHIHVPATNHFLQHHQCCTDNLPRGLFQAAQFVLMKRGEDEVFLTLFNRGEGEILLKNKKVKFNMEGDFLNDSKVETTISPDQPLAFQLHVRIPKWSSKTSVKINGKDYPGEVVNNWMTIEREWKEGDRLDIAFDIPLRWMEFKPERFDSAYHPIQFYDKIWAGTKYEKGSNELNNRKYKNVKALNVNEALPQRSAVAFFYGPLVLSRDVRVTKGDIFSPIARPEDSNKVSVRLIEAPPDIWKGFEVHPGNDQTIRFCDFSSAGNTWSENSRFNTWCILK